METDSHYERPETQLVSFPTPDGLNITREETWLTFVSRKNVRRDCETPTERTIRRALQLGLHDGDMRP